MGKGARLQIVDRDGDNALHWAAFKGTGNTRGYSTLNGYCRLHSSQIVYMHIWHLRIRASSLQGTGI
jgi:hypothetical protein